MPIYEYRCKKCGHISSFLEKSGPKPNHKCEKCQSSELEKMLSAFSTHTGKASSPERSSCPTGTCPLS